MNINIFEYEQYKVFLKNLIKENPKNRGFKAYLAQIAGCERSYLSQVLNSKAQLTPDHAYNISIALDMSPLEQEYWMLLVELGRIATPTYKRFITNKIKSLQTQSNDMKNKFHDPPQLPEKAEILYFSKWYMVAIHLLCGVIKQDQLTQISKHLSLPKEVVEKALNELEQLKLLLKKNNSWRPTQEVLYVHKSSPLCDIHHMNWRQQALLDIQIKNPDSLHLTAVHSISKENFEKIKQILFSSIKSGMEISQNSSEEMLACLNIDYFNYNKTFAFKI